MATLKEPFALDRSLNTTEVTPRNIADVLAEGFSHITGRTASEVEYDNTDSGLTADNVQDAIDEVNGKVPTLPSVDIQTAVDEFETYNGGLLSECKVTLSPIQDLHGYDSPWVGGASKNKLPLVLADIKSANTSGTWSGNIYSVSGGTIEVLVDDANNVIGIKPNGTFSATVIFYLVNNYTFKAGSYALNGCPTGGDSSTYELRIGNIIAQDYGSGATYTLGSDTMSMASIIIRSGQDMSGKNFYPMIRLASESDPTFEPYSNICPISGHTQVEVDVSDGQTTQEQVTVNLGGTYYSGTLDVVSGEFVVTHGYKVFDGSETWNVADANRRVTSPVYDALVITDSSKKADMWCNSYPTTTNLDTYLGNLGISLENKRIFISDGSGNMDVNAFKVLLQNNPLQVAYPLATPLTIQLSPTMVKALVGENHLSAPLEGQEITESKYKQMFTFDDVIAYIQSLS